MRTYYIERALLTFCKMHVRGHQVHVFENPTQPLLESSIQGIYRPYAVRNGQVKVTQK